MHDHQLLTFEYCCCCCLYGIRTPDIDKGAARRGGSLAVKAHLPWGLQRSKMTWKCFHLDFIGACSMPVQNTTVVFFFVHIEEKNFSVFRFGYQYRPLMHYDLTWEKIIFLKIPLINLFKRCISITCWNMKFFVQTDAEIEQGEVIRIQICAL